MTNETGGVKCKRCGNPVATPSNLITDHDECCGGCAELLTDHDECCGDCSKDELLTDTDTFCEECVHEFETMLKSREEELR